MGLETVPQKAKAPVPANVPADRIHYVDLYDPDGISQGYHEAWMKLQQPSIPDLIWTPYNGGHWIATRGEFIRDIYRDPAHFSSEVIWIPKEAGEKYEMVPTRLDPPEHTAYREILDKGLGLEPTKTYESKVRKIAADLVESLKGKGACDFAAEYSQVFPVQVFMSLANLPMKDVPLLQHFAFQITRPEGATPEEKAKTLEQGNDGLFAYVEPIIEARRGKTGDDLITLMVNSNINGEPLTKDKILGLIALLLLAGLDTVVNMLSFVMLFLAKNPEHVKQLRAQTPERLARSAEELIRRFPVVAEARMVAKDFQYHGVDLKRGDMVLVPTLFHGLDARENKCPMNVDFERKGKIAHTTFGDGPHRCAGMHLARMEVAVTLEEWLKRIPEFRLADGAKPVFHSGIVAAVENIPLVWTPAKS